MQHCCESYRPNLNYECWTLSICFIYSIKYLKHYFLYGLWRNNEQKLIKTNNADINWDINLLNYKKIFNFSIRLKMTSINNDAIHIKIKNIQILISCRTDKIIWNIIVPLYFSLFLDIFNIKIAPFIKEK